MEISMAPVIDPASSARRGHFLDELTARLGALPGVTTVGVVGRVPLAGGGPDGQFALEDNPNEKGYAEYRVASPGYFPTMGIPLLRGRLPDERDGPDAPHVAVMSQSAAKAWRAGEPIGQRIQWGNMDGDKRPITIVGIVGDVKEYGLDGTVRPTIYPNS